ncbi:RNA polymerase sigma factor [Sphingosinicella rhizophila]|uniref:RNA polymerase sigma factor n=1 Tax=Sphingosinicella rhizophila TaxID=3050082 RepID=A0ABU3Q9N2_9SPHN|nr:RNA polymerase sigma factor [Sphingosinicella sp. GR2756]MDT9600120.1 RNA polymerase sigma factor [Sphingosinicella sp. GR2756]
MIDAEAIDDWFCREVLPLEPALTRYIRRNWRQSEDVFDLLHDVYALALGGARSGLPDYTQGYVFTIARNLLTQRSRRARIVSFELITDLESLEPDVDIFSADRNMVARDDLRRAGAGIDNLPPRCREVVRLRKVEGLTTREAADRLGVGIDAVEQQLTKGMRALADFMLGGPGHIARPSRRERQERSK